MNALITPPQIEATMDYNKFNFIGYNRDIHQPTVNKLAKLSKDADRFKYFPILVDKSMRIVDGQHRFKTSKELGLPIYYIVMDIEEANWKDINDVNVAGKKHNISELIRLRGKSGDKSLANLLSLYEVFKGTPLLLSTLAYLGYSWSNSGTALEAVRRGEYKIQYPEKLRQMLYFLMFLKDHGFKDWPRNKFIFALVNVEMGYSLELGKMLERIKTNIIYLKMKGSKPDYIEHIIDVHDKHLKTGRIRPVVTR